MLACLGHHRTIVARLAAAGAPLCGDNSQRHRKAAAAQRLIEAVRRHDTPLLETYLDAAGPDGVLVNSTDHDGRTALHAAVREQDRTVRTLTMMFLRASNVAIKGTRRQNRTGQVQKQV